VKNVDASPSLGALSAWARGRISGQIVRRQEPWMLLFLLLVEYLLKSLPAWVVIILIFSMLIGPPGPKK